MSLTRTPKTDWLSSDAINQSVLDGIEQNTLDIENDKMENVSGEVSVSSGIEEDKTFQFASDADMIYKESSNTVEFTKPIEAEIEANVGGISSSGSFSLSRGQTSGYFPRGLVLLSTDGQFIGEPEIIVENIYTSGSLGQYVGTNLITSNKPMTMLYSNGSNLRVRLPSGAFPSSLTFYYIITGGW